MRDSSGHSRAGAAPTTHSPFPRSQASLGSVERRSWPLPPKPALGRCLGEKRNHTYQTGVVLSVWLWATHFLQELSLRLGLDVGWRHLHP